MNRREASLLLIAMAGSVSLTAQELRFREYGPPDGLPAGHIFGIVQDETGYIWLGGARGVFQFDGRTFRQWTQGVPGGRVHALEQTSDGRLWIVASEGVAYRNRGGDSFQRVDIPVAHNARLTRAIAAGPDGRLLLGEGNTLWSLGWKGAQLDIQSYAAPGGANIRALAVDSAGRAWAVCGKQLCRFDRGAIRVEETGLPEETWLAVAAGPQGELAVRGETSLWLREGAGQPFREVPDGPGVVAAFTVDLKFSPEGDLLTNTTRGLAVRRAGKWQNIGIENGLPTRMLSAVRIDREGTAWLGTASEPSLIRWDRRAPWSTWTRAQGLEEETVWGVTRDTAGVLWAAGSSGVFRLGENKRFAPVAANESEYARKLAAAPDGSVWALINRKKVRRWAGGNSQDFALPARALNYLLLDRERRLWAIGDRVFRTRGDVTRGAVTFEQLEPLATDQNEDFTQGSMDAAGRVYLAGTNGLAIFDPAQNAWQRLGQSDGLQSLRLLGVLADSAGRLWVSYRQLTPPTRLIRVNNRWHVDRASMPGELSRTLTVGLAEDAAKRIWLTTEAGVFVWNQSQWRHYRRDDGLRSEDCVQGAVMADPSGDVWVGTTRGLARFDSHKPALPPVPPPTAAVADLELGEGNVSFGLRSLSYWREADQLFLYRLQGRRFFGSVFDSGWQETRNPQVRYGSLPGGNYLLEAKARNADQLWSMQPFEQRFEVPIAWYASTWFGLGLLVGAPAALYGAWRIRRRHHAALEEQRREYLESEVARRTQEIAVAKTEAEASLRQKGELLAALSEQVRAPMHAFMGLTQLALTTREEGKRNEYLRTAHESSEALLATLGDLLDYAESEGGRLSLRPATCDLRDCVRGLALLERRIAWEVAGNLPRLVRVDRRRLRQVLLTLVTRALERAPASRVRLTVGGEQTSATQVSLAFTVEGGEVPAGQTRGPVTSNRTALKSAVALRLAELMGGRLVPVSDPPGVAFVVNLPVPAGDATEARRVLLLEADAPRRRMMASLMEEGGFAVTAGEIDEASDFSVVVVSDVEAARRVRAQDGATRIVLIAEAGAPEPDVADVADAVVAAPVRAEELLRALLAPARAGRS